MTERKNRSMNQITLDFLYEWKPICQEKEKIYFFPNSISSYMRKQYCFPAIYRWNIYKNESEDQQTFYIGEAQELCPQRINGYLNPGPSQKTNQRVNAELMIFLARGYQVSLDFLHIENFICDQCTYTAQGLEDKYFRRLIEELMVLKAHQAGYQLINL